ncbi:CD3073 family putative ECF transporter S component [Faecalimonas sp.]
MNKSFSATTRMVFCGLAIALNIALGIVTTALKFPFYLDVMGTIFIAILFGPWYGATVGGITNLLTSIFSGSLSGIPFMLVSIAIGLIVGFAFRKINFTFLNAIFIGIIISIVAPLIGTPIGIAVYGGLTGTVSDIAVMFLKQSGTSIFTASFIPKLFNNLLDKIGSMILVYLLITALPPNLKTKKNM